MYRFYLDGLMLPLVPPKVEFSTGSKNEVLSLVSGANLNVLRAPKLQEISFTCRLPSDEFPAVRSFVPPDTVLQKLKELKEKAEPFEFVIDKNFNGFSELVSLEEYDIIEDAELGFDITVKISLKKYEPVKTNSIATTSADGASIQQDAPKIDENINDAFVDKEIEKAESYEVKAAPTSRPSGAAGTTKKAVPQEQTFSKIQMPVLIKTPEPTSGKATRPAKKSAATTAARPGTNKPSQPVRRLADKVVRGAQPRS